MKRIVSLCLCASVFNLSAAVPLRWTVETSAANPATFDQFAGATYDLEAALQSRGKPLAVDGEPQLFWQTNGMGAAWWTAPASISGNVLRATWTPSCDVGARAYNCFIGITGTVYNAAFQLRLRPSPGAVPNELPLPQKVIDFAKVTVLNPPWSGGGGGVDTNAVERIANRAVETNAVTVAATNDIHALVSATNDLASSVASHASQLSSHASQLSQLSQSKRDKSDYSAEDGKEILLFDKNIGMVSLLDENGDSGYYWFNNGGIRYTEERSPGGDVIIDSSAGVMVIANDDDGGFTYNGAKIATTNDVSAAVSTNNPAFVEAVRNTPHDESTPWGEYGTVGAAIAGLVALVALMAKRSAFAPEYSASSAYAVGDYVWHDGDLYQCKTAIAAPGEAWTPEHWNGPQKLDDFFKESTSYIGELPTPTGKLKNTKLDQAVQIVLNEKGGGGGSQGYEFVDLVPTTESGYKVFAAHDHAINRFTLSDATPVKVVLPNATDANSRDLVIKVNVTSATMPTFEIVKPADAASVGVEAADDGWADLEAGINYFTITETDRA